MKLKNEKLNAVKEYVAISIGLLVYVVAWKFFIIPQGITGGGATGIATVIYYATNEAIPVSASYLVINALLLVAAWFTVGKQFTIRTAVGVGITTVWLALPLDQIFEHFAGQKFPTFEPFMSVIIAGFMCGFGLSLAFTNNASTGGTDIIAKIINKYKDMALGRAMTFTDIVIIFSSLFFAPNTSIESVVYGLIFMLVTFSMMDIYINGFRQSVQYFIVTKKPEIVAEAIASKAHRGVTLLNGMGWYTKEDMKVVMVLVRKHESSSIFHIVKDADPEAFISQVSAMGVYGRGFDSLRS